MFRLTRSRNFLIVYLITIYNYLTFVNIQILRVGSYEWLTKKEASHVLTIKSTYNVREVPKNTI